jgi:hypothetical protein
VSDSLPTGGGTKEHGTVTAGLTAVKAQAANQKLRSWLGQNAGPGKLYPGGASVTTANTIAISVGDSFVFDQSGDDLYLIADQAATVCVFVREIAP